MKDSNISNYLSMLCHNKGYTMGEVSKLTGISVSYISLVERGKRKPSPQVLKKYAVGLNESYSKLMEMTGYLHRDGKGKIDPQA